MSTARELIAELDAKCRWIMVDNGNSYVSGCGG